MAFENLPERETGHVTVVKIQECRTIGFNDQCAVVESMLIGIEPDAAIDRVPSAVRQLDNVFKPERLKPAAHSIRYKFRNHNPDRPVELPQRRVVKMIEMPMG